MYGGHWMRPFGHFITETLTNLWPVGYELDGLVFHTWLTQERQVAPWQRKLLSLAGLDGLPLRFVGRHPASIERLLVPERPFVPNGWAHPQAVDVWRRVAESVSSEDSPECVFLSRTTFNDRRRAAGHSTRTSAERDRELDELFTSIGFHLVTPEELDVEDQARLAANCQILAGPSGSALHLACFMRRPGQVLEIGDSRSPAMPLANQQVIDAACGHRSAFIAHDADVPAALGQLALI